MQIFLYIKKTYKLFTRYRSNGAPFVIALVMVLCRVFNFILSKYSMYEYEPIHDVPSENKPKVDINSIVHDKPSDTTLSKNTHKSNNKGTFIWFIPHCTNIWGGGHYTLFRFINYFNVTHNVDNIVFIYDMESTEDDVQKLQNDLNETFSTNKFVLTNDFAKLPECEIAIATTWQSAYFAYKKNAALKFYFMQDYESLFYPAGSLALQANYTYSFGFYGITGGDWLKSKFESYGYKAQSYVFSADRNIFYPSNKNANVRDIVRKIFFYGRPSTPRRAYELGIKSLELISAQYPDIEIVIAGLSGIEISSFKCTLLGNLSLKETGDLYRTCDIGIALSATNMSYLPVELMASGCPVISNAGEQVEWYCKNNYNSILVDPTPSSILNAVTALVESKELRQKLAINGLTTTSQTTWDNEMEKIFQYIQTTKRNMD